MISTISWQLPILHRGRDERRRQYSLERDAEDFLREHGGVREIDLPRVAEDALPEGLHDLL